MSCILVDPNYEIKKWLYLKLFQCLDIKNLQDFLKCGAEFVGQDPSSEIPISFLSLC